MRQFVALFDVFVMIELRHFIPNSKMKTFLKPMSMTFLRYMMIWSLSAILSLAIGVGLVLLITTAIDYYYELNHPMIIGEDDMGYGVIMIFWITTVSIVTLPLVVFGMFFFKKIISNYFKS